MQSEFYFLIRRDIHSLDRMLSERLCHSVILPFVSSIFPFPPLLNFHRLPDPAITKIGQQHTLN